MTMYNIGTAPIDIRSSNVRKEAENTIEFILLTVLMVPLVTSYGITNKNVLFHKGRNRKWAKSTVTNDMKVIKLMQLLFI